MKLTYLSTAVLIVLPAVLRVSGGNDEKKLIIMDCTCLWTATSSKLKTRDTGEFVVEHWAEQRKCQQTKKIPDCQVCCTHERGTSGPKELEGQLLMKDWLQDPDEGFTVKLTGSQTSSEPLPSDSGSDSDSTHSSH
jgi:hypothetical protein